MLVALGQLLQKVRYDAIIPARLYQWILGPGKPAGVLWFV